jgi:NAD(P)-dependent dehydrogenase (short-subunit alcohol dehydrogenase family)
MRDQVCVITGSNSGIGKETARALTRMGAAVVLVCRDPERGGAARDELAAEGGGPVTLHVADLANLASVRAAAAAIAGQHDHVDVLINNAGIYLPRRIETVDGHEATLQINHLGHFVLTLRLMPLLRAAGAGAAGGARVISLASEAHRGGRMDFDDLQLTRGYAGFKAYSRWKLGNILFTRALARRLEGTGITANCLHPGVIGSGRPHVDLPGKLPGCRRRQRPVLRPQQAQDPRQPGPRRRGRRTPVDRQPGAEW